MATSPTTKQLREFGLLLAIAFPLLLGWLLPALRGHGFHPWTLWIAISALSLGLIDLRTMQQPYQWCMDLGQVLGWLAATSFLGSCFCWCFNRSHL